VFSPRRRPMADRRAGVIEAEQSAVGAVHGAAVHPIGAINTPDWTTLHSSITARSENAVGDWYGTYPQRGRGHPGSSSQRREEN